MEARYIKISLRNTQDGYQDARNIYLQKLKKAKCLYLNTAVEEIQGNQKKLFGLLDSITKEPMGNQLPPDSEESLADGFASFFGKKLKLFANPLILRTVLKYLSPIQIICQGCHLLKQCLKVR